jgi:hypothetical protein
MAPEAGVGIASTPSLGSHLGCQGVYVRVYSIHSMDAVIHIRLTPQILGALIERARLEGRSKNAMGKMLLMEALSIRPEMRSVPKVAASEKLAVARKALDGAEGKQVRQQDVALPLAGSTPARPLVQGRPTGKTAGFGPANLASTPAASSTYHCPRHRVRDNNCGYCKLG